MINYSIREKRLMINQFHKLKTLLSDPDRWCKLEFARDANGQATLEYHKNACSWCIAAAIQVVASRSSFCFFYTGFRQQLVDKMKSVMRWNMPESHHKLSGLEGFNDHPDTKHSDILALIDKSIESLDY